MSLRERYRRYVDDHCLYDGRGYPALDFRCRQLFFHVSDLREKAILEVGAGEGLISLWALANGATKVVLLEPEADGAVSGIRDKFYAHKRALGVSDKQIAMYPCTFQEYDGENNTFDILLAYKSINHIDEAACVNMMNSQNSWSIYKKYFQKVYRLIRPGGYFVLSDAGRLNLWNLFGFKSPFSPSIEWKKHQEPKVWRYLAAKNGFAFLALTYHKFFPLRRFGVLGANFLMARVTTSQFVLTMLKSPEEGTGREFGK